MNINGNESIKYLFVPSNDTHVHWMYPLAQALKNSFFMVIEAKNERADFYLNELAVRFITYRCGILQTIKPSVLVFGCDWGGHEQQVIREAKVLGIPTVCIQEGCLDFMDQRTNRMLHADYAFLQGPVMRKYIRKENNVFVTGNPKYDSLYETPLPHTPTVMINSNFTYGIFEDARDQWVRDVAETCKSLGLDFFISQHPRDKGVFPPEYPVYKSDAFKIQKQLQKTSLLVSRFSTVIYEAAAMGREIVYYNPHREPFRIFAYDVTGGIRIAHSPSNLAQVIQSAVHNPDGNNENRRKFILQHCSTLEHNAVNKCSECLQAIAARDIKKLSLLSQNAGKQENWNLEYGDNKNPTVSVIIPCYNTAKYLGEAIDSVLSQTFSDFEIIVVDDASTDNPDEVTNSFNDPRIHFFRHSENKGPSAARNTGIRHARGKYICFLDSDDYFLPHKLKEQVTFLENYPDYGLVGGAFMRVDEDDNVLRESTPKAHPVFPEEMLIRNRFCMDSTLIRRTWIERAGFFDESLSAAEDWDLHCRLIMLGCLMYRMDNIICAYRLRSSSLSTDPQVHTKHLMKVIEKNFVNIAKHPELCDIQAQAKGFTHLRAATFYYAANDVQNGRYHFAQALRDNPNFYKNNYDMITRLLSGWIDHLNVDSPADYFQILLDNLPEEACSMHSLRKQIIHSATSHRILSSYKNKHRGQRCVIISNGHSLKEMDLSFLKSEITIGLDQIDLSINQEDFSPNYYICLNPLLIDQRPQRILQMTSTKFLDIEFLNIVENPTDFVFLSKIDQLIFTKDAREALGSFGTSAFAALQLAYFMGFDEIILIGNDHHLVADNIINQKTESHKDANVLFALDHFGEGPRNSLTDLEKVTVTYQMAKRTFESDGRRIIDATVGNKLSIFPKADYREIFFSKLYQVSTGQKVSYKQFNNIDFNNQNKVDILDVRKDNNNTNNVIRWGNLWDEPRPDAIRNFFSIANSYKELGQFYTAGTLFEKILRPLRDAIDGIDFTACLEFVKQQEIAKCFVSTCTELAQCYSKQGAWDKVKQIYLSLLNRKNLILLEQQKIDILNVLKKLENVKIPENAFQFETIDSESHYKTNALKIRNKSISEPPISVIIPAYNAEEHIAAAIESVLTQNYRNIELVIINDGSTDNTEEIAAGFKDARIKYFRQENRGLAVAHNTGIKQSRGEFIIKLDSDDMMAPNFISRHIQEFENHPEVDLVYCNDYLIDENSKPIRVIDSPEYTDRKSLIRDLFRCGYPIIPFRTCIRKNVFDKIGFFDESLSVAEDYDMIRRFVQHGLKVHHLKDALYLRRMGFDSLSRNFNPRKAKSHFEVVKRYVDTFRHDELFPDVDWNKIAPERIELHARCLAASTYLAMGQAHKNAKSPPYYVKTAFEMASQQLNDCHKIDPENRQISELLQKCKLGQEMYVTQFQESVNQG